MRVRVSALLCTLALALLIHSGQISALKVTKRPPQPALPRSNNNHKQANVHAYERVAGPPPPPSTPPTPPSPPAAPPSPPSAPPTPPAPPSSPPAPPSPPPTPNTPPTPPTPLTPPTPPTSSSSTTTATTATTTTAATATATTTSESGGNVTTAAGTTSTTAATGTTTEATSTTAATTTSEPPSTQSSSSPNPAPPPPKLPKAPSARLFHAIPGEGGLQLWIKAAGGGSGARVGGSLSVSYGTASEYVLLPVAAEVVFEVRNNKTTIATVAADIQLSRKYTVTASGGDAGYTLTVFDDNDGVVDADDATLRLVHLIATEPPLSLKLDGYTVTTPVAYAHASPYKKVSPDTFFVQLITGAENTTLASAKWEAEADAVYTLFAYGDASRLKDFPLTVVAVADVAPPEEHESQGDQTHGPKLAAWIIASISFGAVILCGGLITMFIGCRAPQDRFAYTTIY